MTLDQVDTLAGTVPRQDSLVVDYQEAVTPGQARSLNRLVMKLNRRFPQSTFAVLFFPSPLPPLLYAFWLSNRAKFGPRTAVFERNFSVFLLVDNDARKAGLSVGYGLERVLTRETLAACLHAGRRQLAAGRVAEGVKTILKTLAIRMAAAAAANPIGLPPKNPGTGPPPSEDEF